MRVSADLIWECLKDSSSFIRKSRNAPVMTAEPSNLCGLNSFKFSGLACQKPIDVSIQTTGKKQTIMLMKKPKSRKVLRRPKMFVGTGIKNETKKGIEAITKEIDGAFYRKDLKDMIVQKYLKIKQSFRKNKKIPVLRKAKATSK
eukprot:CAMPEP_0185906076 /NCGR_PEP_ID=MMETSP0196C-20130402/5216_1 /TAXON_ID=2932 /ORGANISM="Alexandrium fundyense, Strain CCMP1719" /LENGTH=144 /DNA_ID=CAMNT_0028625739 /DNA_START=71 /DNA_END=505 /DNA_ORIENTATION=-